MTTTDTPRTDAELEKPRDGVYSSFFSMASHAKQLERELAEAKQWLNERYKALSEADDRAEKAEANLRRAIEIAEDSTESLMDWDENRRSETQRKNHAELNSLKSSLSSP